MDPCVPGREIFDLPLGSSRARDNVMEFRQARLDVTQDFEDETQFSWFQHAAVCANWSRMIDSQTASELIAIVPTDSDRSSPQRPCVDRILHICDLVGWNAMLHKVLHGSPSIGKPPIDGVQRFALVPLRNNRAPLLPVRAVSPEGYLPQPQARSREQRMVPKVLIRLLNDEQIRIGDVFPCPLQN